LSLLAMDGAMAWGPEGHTIIAQLATNMLTPAASKEVSYLLDGQTIMDVVNEPDDYDHTTQGAWSACLHYVNMDLDQSNFSMSEDCGPVGTVPTCCVVAAIENYTTIVTAQVQNIRLLRRALRDDDNNDSSEPVPLSFLSHFVGDVHQPLHVGYGCDTGGNVVNVILFGEDTNLHASWDTGMIEHYNSDANSFAEELQETLDKNPYLASNYTANMTAEWWADESFTYVRNDVYVWDPTSSPSMSALKRAPITYPGNCPLTQTITLTDDYYNYNIEVIKQRLMAAGVRLGTLLNQILVD